MKKIILIFVIVTSWFTVSVAHAYLTFGRVWSSTANPKNPVAYSGNIPSSYLAKINNSLADWDLLPGANIATVFISNRWTWSNSFDRANNVGHLRTVVTHEFGHAWGIAHPQDDGGSMTAAERNSVMNSNFTVKYVPNSADIAAMASMY